jgi:hypothetical protein
MARRTRDNAFSLRDASTLMRAPLGKTISIDPVLPVIEGCSGASAGSGGISSAGRRGTLSPITPTGTDATSSGAPAATAAPLRADRQFYSRLSDIPCRCATRRTLPPSASTSANGAAFSCAPQIRRRSRGPRISTSDKRGSFWSPEGGSRDQQHRCRPGAPPLGPGRTLTLLPRARGGHDLDCFEGQPGRR